MQAVTVGVCERCGEKRTTSAWAETETQFARGYSQQWCKECILRVQIDHAEKCEAMLPTLRAQLLQWYRGGD